MKICGISFKNLLPWKLAAKLREMSSFLNDMSEADFNGSVTSDDDDIFGELAQKAKSASAMMRKKIDAIKQERTQLNLIINSMAEGVVVTDKNGTIKFANFAWHKLFNSNNSSIGLPVLEVVRCSELYDNMLAAIASGAPSEKEITHGGRSFRASSVPFESILMSGCITVINDMTKVRHLENIRREFSANVSHQMKTPLTSILGYSETLLNGAIENKNDTKQFVQTIYDQAQRLKELIDDILKLAAIESPSWVIEKTNVNLEEVVNAAVSDFVGNKKDISLNINVEPINFESDHRSVKHILHNLIDNAVKYTPKGGNVDVKGYSRDGNIVIRISDTGSGIPAEELERVFERFYRSSSSSRIEGSGLGLAIVKHLVDKLGGDVSVESREDKGSVFEVILPQ